MKRGFSAVNLYAYNPMPPGLTLADIRKRAGLEVRDSDEGVPAFDIGANYSTGAEHEYVRLAPGDILVLRGEQDARTISGLFRDTQCVAILKTTPDKDPAACVKASIAVLQPVRDFFRARGAKLANRMMQEAKIPREEREDYKPDFFPYFENQARSEFIDEHIKALKAELAVAPAPKQSKKAA